MIDFFISYTQADREWAEWIAWVLEDEGFQVYLQSWDFRPGSNFVLEMQNAATGAVRTIAVLSPDYEKSGFTKPEWAAAFAKDPTGEKGTLLPVRVKEMSPEGMLAPLVYIDLVDLPESSARNCLIAGLNRERAKPAQKPSYPGHPRPDFPGELSRSLKAEEAGKLLGMPPQDVILAPGPLPSGSRMPLAPNPLFLGRDEDLRVLAFALGSGEPEAIARAETIAITGLGGVGKTQLASEFVHRYGKFFTGGVFWMNFADPANVPAEVADCGRCLGLDPNYEDLTLDRQVLLVRNSWKSQTPRLLVFDNCDDQRLFTEWRPPSGRTWVLLTSKQPHWHPSLSVKAFPLDTLRRPASVDLLLRFRPDIPREHSALDGIGAELGDLPLALHLAGSFLYRYRDAPFGQPTAYLEQLRSGRLLDHPSLRGHGVNASPTNRDPHIARTFFLSYQRLGSETSADNMPRRLLARSGFFAPNVTIPRSLLLATLGAPVSDLDTQVRNEDALTLLVELGLLAPQPGAVILHSLVSAFVKSQVVSDEDRVSVEETFLCLAKSVNKSGRQASLRGWAEHFRHFVRSFPGRRDLGMALLRNELGLYLGNIGEFSEALACNEAALAIRRSELGLAHSLVADSLNNVGYLLRQMGDFSGSLASFQTALALRLALLGRNETKTAQSLNNLGQSYQEVGQLDRAERCFRWAIRIREEALGLGHQETGIVLNNLGMLLGAVGELEESESALRRALQIAEQNLDPEHPEIARVMNNLASVLQDRGDLGNARRLYKRSLRIRRKAFGMEHPDVARILHNMACLEGDLGRPSASLCLLKRALGIRQRVLGEDHPETGQNLDVLGQYYMSVGDMKQARLCFEKAKEIFRKRFGADDPRTFWADERLKKVEASGEFGA
jgi:tetratricopeptide (TPR) repeat protein